MGYFELIQTLFYGSFFFLLENKIDASEENRHLIKMKTTPKSKY